MTFSFDPRASLIVIRARLTGPSTHTDVQLALDTGATMTMVSRRTLAYLGYDPLGVSDRVPITTGSGVEYVPEITIASIQSLGHEYRNFPVLCHTLPPSATVDGVLGLDFLRDKRLVLDFRAGLITLD